MGCSEYATLGSISKVMVPWPPFAKVGALSKPWSVPDHCRHIHLPLRTFTDEPPRPSHACAARIKPMAGCILAAELVNDFKISPQDMMMVYMSPDPYHVSFEQTMDLGKFDLSKHATGGLSLYVWDGRVHLASISPSTPAARIHGWRSRIGGAWLIKVGAKTIASIEDMVEAFDQLRTMAHPIILTSGGQTQSVKGWHPYCVISPVITTYS